MIGKMYSEDHSVDSLMYAYSPFTSDAESEAIRIETERRDALVDAWHEGHREQRRYRGRSAVVAWLIISWLVGFVGGLAWLVWGAL